MKVKIKNTDINKMFIGLKFLAAFALIFASPLILGYLASCLIGIHVGESDYAIMGGILITAAAAVFLFVVLVNFMCNRISPTFSEVTAYMTRFISYMSFSVLGLLLLANVIFSITGLVWISILSLILVAVGLIMGCLVFSDSKELENLNKPEARDD